MGVKMTDSARTIQTIDVFIPAVAESRHQEGLAPRLFTLNGKTIGLLNNTKDLVDVLLDEVRTQLRAYYPRAEFRDYRKLSVSGAAPRLLEDLTGCDAVITAVGD
jgi:hypothetical protein